MEKPVLFIITFIVGFLINLSLAQVNTRCITANNERALCIPLQDCTFLYNLFLSPDISDTDKEYLRKSQCGYANRQVLICCPNRYRQKQSNGGQNNGQFNNARPTQFQAPEANANARPSSNDLIPQPPVCGNIITNRIYGGNLTKIDEFPFMVLIEYTKPGKQKGHHCGGSLISSRYVITAAHCVNGRGLPTNWRLSGVRLGEWDTTTNPDCDYPSASLEPDCAPEYVDVPVESTITHPSYNSNSRNQLHDIALLRLSRAVPYNDFIRPICLPTATNLRSSTFEGVAMDVSGWGRTEKVSESTQKLKATVNGQSLRDCQRKYGARNINLESTQLCAGGVRGVDSCRGDSGGPLIGLEQNYLFLAGVVSFGPTPCGLEGWPGVYTRVGNYIDWIRQTMQA